MGNLIIISIQYKDFDNSLIDHIVKFYFIGNYFVSGEEITKISTKNYSDYRIYFNDAKAKKIASTYEQRCIETYENRYCNTLKDSDVSNKYRIKYELELKRVDTLNEFIIKENYSFVLN